ncbi:MAG: hypothetical protein HON98_06165 [Chloroflexi bacterium]|nr:hypothetical protein [Chloroflexota bacterium]MBT4002454.1 hypothetical protein [Chloroflexota bacterium]MBT4304464.1 hypothetical protein [Chloroflexota bacterium]MBT4534195.1 hypothetical protein [Chloroflexota bacterium]MBT4683414.1 hypothetical protein [Chloroflexota bacterium]
MKKAAWHENLIPLFFAIFPVLSLALENYEFIKFSSILRSLLISIIVVYSFYLLFYLIFKDPRKSGILSGILIFILITYGNVYLFLENQLGQAVRHRYLIGAYVIFLIIVGAYVILKVKNAKELSLAFFTGGMVIVLYLLVSIGFIEYEEYRADVTSEEKGELFVSNTFEVENSNLPDIYLIVLDSYTRSDVLQKVYDYDNSDFIDNLEELGFRVAKCAQSNYPFTSFSMTSLFEMDYIHNIYNDYDDFEDVVFPPLNRTATYQILSNNDYSLATFQNNFIEHFDILDDIKFSKEDGLLGSINEFEEMVVNTSILRILITTGGIFPDSWVRGFKDNISLTYYRESKYALETLPSLADQDEQLFVYVHLLVNHSPYVFMPDGSFRTSEPSPRIGYRDTVEFIDNVLPDILGEIIDNSEVPPIIILMADHGARLAEASSIYDRLSVLMAIYLQGEPIDEFYDQITPANVFRIIFNYLFDANIELIEDKSFEIWNLSQAGNFDKEVLAPCNP